MSIHPITARDENETNLHLFGWTREKTRRSRVERSVLQL